MDPLARIHAVLRSEGQAVLRLAVDCQAQGDQLRAAVALITERCGDQRGRLITTGIGKAGLIATKLAATFASTGTPAQFLHPAEARHGDLGVIGGNDVVLALSNSGTSEEMIALLPSLSRIGCQLIALVGRTDSPLAAHAEVVVTIGDVGEAGPLGLAPTNSTTAMLALGDAIALAVQEQRDFTPEQYARFHPGGALGRKLMTCAEAMRSDGRVATIAPETPVADTLRAITSARAGSAILIDGAGGLIGIFTDGDLRRALADADPAQVLAGPVRAVATCPCRAVTTDDLLQHALHLCAEHHVNELPVVDDDRRVVGLIDLQDLVDRGFEIEPR